MKDARLALVTRVSGYVHSARNQPFFIGGVPASRDNIVIISRCLEDWLFLIEDLMVRQGLEVESRISRMSNFVDQFLQLDFLDLVVALESVFSFLVSEEKFPAEDAFKQHLERTDLEGVNWGRLLSPINSLLYLFLFEIRAEQRALFLPSIAQFLRFPKKVSLRDIGLEDEAILDYLINEDELGAVQYDQEILDGISKIIHRWFKDFEIENLKPKNGIGSVAEGPLTLAQKFKVMKVDKKVKILLSNPSDPSSYMGYFPYPPEEGLERTSRTIFVPKTVNKLRTISMEPATLQYLQQGVMYELYKYIAHHRYLGVRIRLDDQRQNQVLSWEGSLRHNYGTIDLSHASDSVSWTLVRNVFKRVPKLYKWLLATRSIFTELPKGEKLRLRKFAPMGSALCFPIECIVFAAIVEYASGKVYDTRKEQPALYSVYGDDLVVPSVIYDETVRVLSACGFTVNTSKSYNTGEYRESCGKDYYAGVDISALYYRTPFYKRRVSPSAYGAWCSMANNAFLHNLPLYRWYLIKKILALPLKHGPCFRHTPDASPFLYSPQPTNFHMRKRWNVDYQREEIKCTVVKSRPLGSEPDDEYLRYFIKLVDMARRGTIPPTIEDESPHPYVLHGCVEFFSSTILPAQGYVKDSILDATSWWDT